jgi:hypothetical protein
MMTKMNKQKGCFDDYILPFSIMAKTDDIKNLQASLINKLLNIYI